MAEVETALAEGVLELTLNRPDKKNALTRAMYAALADALEGAQQDMTVRCVLIRSEGADFCAGNDLHDFISGGEAAFSVTMRFLHALADLEAPLVAAVQGRAVGVGATLLLHCDLISAAPDASLVLPFVKLGLTPEAGSSQLLPALVGHRVAAEMVLLGRPVSAERAFKLGLINEVDNNPSAAARALAREVARQPAAAVRAAKKLLRARATPLDERIDAEGRIFLQRLRSPDFLAAAQAFFARGKG